MTIAFICAFIYYHFKHRHFKIVRATCRRWVTSRTGDLVTYRIQIMTRKASDELTLDELWIDNRLFRIRLVKKESQAVAKHFAEKESLYIEAERETGKVHYEEMQLPTKGKVSLGYMINNKRRYLSIKGFEENNAKLSIAEKS